MAEEFLQRIDEAFDTAPRRAARLARRPLTQTAAPAPAAERETAPDGESSTDSLGVRQFALVEAFVALQFLWGALVFLPGAQDYRGYIRALPYLASLGMLGLFGVLRRHEPFARGSGLVIGALLLLVLNLLHPSTQLNAGVAQCIFQLSIAAPLFWAHKTMRSAREFERLLVMMFLLNAASAGLGVLQVYFPERFMPAEFNSLGIEMNQYYVDGLTYLGPDGRLIVRPPGLSDQPGAAATAGAFAAILGLGLLLRRRTPLVTLGLLASIAVGFAAIYFSQVRSTLLATIAAWSLLTVVALQRGRLARAAWVLGVGAALVVGSYVWASSVGGESMVRRFDTIQGTGAIAAFQSGRGIFVRQTVGELLDQYPFGAGVGRWGMMNNYFASRSDYGSTPIYVEVQLTGWLLDGGLLMWLLYGGALLVTMWIVYRDTSSRDLLLSEAAIIVLAMNAFVLVLTLVAPVFNTQLGLLFWTMTACLHGAFRAEYSRYEPSVE
jgi:hypothetical protein